MRGLSASPERRCSSCSASSRPSRPKYFCRMIDHGPEMPAFLDIDLEHVAHVVERRRGLAEMALLLDRGRLGVALDDDQPAQHGAVFARHLLPDGLAVDAGRTGSCGSLPAGQARMPQRYSGIFT